MSRIFLLSPASCTGQRARLVLNERATFALARALRAPAGAALGEVFSFLSGLYFRGKLRYASAFASPPVDLPGVLVITPSDGLVPANTAVTLQTLRRWSTANVDPLDPRYLRPLLRDARRLTRTLAAHADTEVVLLGSIATPKYVEPLRGVLGDRLRFPPDFVGRGDMSRGGLLLRCTNEGRELPYVTIEGSPRRGSRPERLPRRSG